MCVHAFDHDGGVHAKGRAVGRYFRNVATDNDGAAGNASVGNLTGSAVKNGSALADENTHTEHRVFFNDYAFDHFRASADKAVVFNNGRAGLHRLQYAANSNAA